MAEETLPKQLEKLLAEAGVEAVTGPILVSWPVSIYSKDRPRVKVKERHPVPSSSGRLKWEVTERCFDDNAIDLAGQGTTDPSGRRTWRLTEFICAIGDYIIVQGPVSFVATPISKTPVYLTTTISIPEPPHDLLVEVYSWEPAGHPAPAISFSWRCRARYEEVVA